MRHPIRLAILECDVPLSGTQTKYGGYGGVFEALLQASAKGLNQPHIVDPETGLDIKKFNIQANPDDYPKLEDIDAILITGARYNSYDDSPWILKLVKYTKEVLDHDRVRVVGVCFGHQIIGRALGSKVGPNEEGWEVSVYNIDLTEQGKQVLGLEKLRLHQMHRDIVYDCPPNVISLGSTPRCAVQGMYLPRRFISFQGHPEFTEEIVTELLQTRKYMGVFPPGVYDDGMALVKTPHDGIAVGQAFLKFLAEE
ncbi:hypothetical protein FQN57_007521 [Myotisia sp. PD_48]|nr:hypothetical protein FQN57_007521 [Myotisia sp. PD_48]